MFRTVEEVLNDPDVTEAERELIAACTRGGACLLNGGKLPELGDTRRQITVRASVIRVLAIGGAKDCGLHDAGMWLEGAMITGHLDLRFAKCKGRLALDKCRFLRKPSMEQAEFLQLSLTGSHLPGLFAPGAKITGSVFLNGMTATGTVNLNNARIGGQLVCSEASLDGSKDGAGRRMLALDAQTLLAEAIIFRKIENVIGRIDLASAKCSDLADDIDSWTKCDDLTLDGFSYDRISGLKSPKSFASRESWLKKGSHFDGEFRPQPYTQFAKVMRAAGHDAEARKALMARDTILFEEAEKADRKAFKAAYSGGIDTKGDSGVIWLRLHLRRLWASLSRRVIGHGHQPQYALFWALALWGIGGVAYALAYHFGLMVPNSDVIMVSQEWLDAVAANREAPTAVWMGDGVRASTHYETFYAAIFALDKFLPLVDLGQESTWAVTTTTVSGIALRWLTFGYQVGGWVITSLGIAAITGFVQRNAPD